MTTLKPDYHAYVMAVQRVERQLREVTAALDGAEIPYAVIGGNAVAAWVSRVDPDAVRSTHDVDLMVNRDSLAEVTRVFEAIGYTCVDLRRLVLFLGPDSPSRRSGVRLVWAGEFIQPSYPVPAPGLAETERDPQGFRVLELRALVRMKLTSFRLIDQVHIQDLIRVGLINDEVRNAVPESLRDRLDEIVAATDPDDPH